MGGEGHPAAACARAGCEGAEAAGAAVHAVPGPAVGGWALVLAQGAPKGLRPGGGAVAHAPPGPAPLVGGGGSGGPRGGVHTPCAWRTCRWCSDESKCSPCLLYTSPSPRD
eukprot:3589966-Alexandrium_andersonii.AAC.1